jgi:hypothetical protein
MSNRKNYSYDPDETGENVIQVLVTQDLMADTAFDPLRTELGYTFSTNIYESAEGLLGNELVASYGQLQTEKESLRDFTYAKLTTNSRYIDFLEIMPSQITTINPKGMFPNLKVPVRLYATEGSVYDDKFWRTLFTGGSYGEQEYKSLINTSTIFNDYAFTYANSYTSLYAKSVGIHESCPNLNKIIPKYNNYNLDVRDHQAWEGKIESELLIPNYYVMQTISYITDAQFGSSISNAAKQLAPSLQLYTALSASDDKYGLHEQELHAKLYGIADHIRDNVSNKAKRYFESIYLPLLRVKNFNETLENNVRHSQRNIIMPNAYFGIGPGDAREGAGQVSPDIFPYYNVIKWPRHGESEEPLPISIGSSYDGLHDEEPYIRNAFANKNFSAKFLESLKDVHQGTFPGLTFGSKRLHVEYSGLELMDSSEYSVSTNRTVRAKNFRTLDLIKMMQMIYNNPSASLDNNYTFVGVPDSEYQTTYEDNKLYRYFDNSNLVRTLDNIYKKIKDLYDLRQDKFDHSELRDGDTAEYVNSIEDVESMLHFLFNCNYAHAETLAYRVEKSAGSTTGDYTNSQVLQDYWVFNSYSADPEMTIYDTQVKYGKDYTYKVYAYVAVTGKRYMYKDFRLTKQIGTLDTGPDGAGDGAWDVAPVAPDGDPEYYCLQFYDPITGELADQLFNTGNQSKITNTTVQGKALNYETVTGLTESLSRGDTDTSALAQRNALATNNVDMSEHPFIADFHLHVEPCIKLVEIPLFKKKLKILDNPANDMVAIPFQYMDDSRQIGFNMRYESFNSKRPYPVSITKKDKKRSADYQYANDLLPGANITAKSKSPQKYIEVYRTETKPTTFADFENNLVDTIDLQIEDTSHSYSDTFYKTKIPTNRTFYYVFRFVSENLVPGHMSQVLQCELIDDGDYIYSKFDVLADQLGEQSIFKEPSKSLKKLFQIEPNLSQVALNTSNIDFTKIAQEEINNLTIGDPSLEELIWGERFKIRLISKKTGKQLDLNIEFEVKDEDRMALERGSTLLYIGKISRMEAIERIAFLTGTPPDTESGGPTGMTPSVPVSARPGFEGTYEAFGELGETVELGHMTLDDSSPVKPIQVGED